MADSGAAQGRLARLASLLRGFDGVQPGGKLGQRHADDDVHRSLGRAANSFPAQSALGPADCPAGVSQLNRGDLRVGYITHMPSLA